MGWANFSLNGLLSFGFPNYLKDDVFKIISLCFVGTCRKFSQICKLVLRDAQWSYTKGVRHTYQRKYTRWTELEECRTVTDEDGGSQCQEDVHGTIPWFGLFLPASS